jgi:deoxyadenosine/deoxycytidine kinase
MNQHSEHRYIVVEGPIGVGKTSLARRLAESFGSELVLEDAENNPFLERFYRSPKQGAFPTQLFFLFQRAHQMQDLRQGDMFNPVRVADFLMEKDRLFAELTLDEDELKLYEQVHEKLDINPPVPDLVIYLQAPVEILKQRVSRRGISHEQRMDSGYLSGLVEAYAKFFHSYQSSPLLIVNATEIDLVNNDEDYKQLLQRIRSVHSGRHYFNPMPIAM